MKIIKKSSEKSNNYNIISLISLLNHINEKKFVIDPRESLEKKKTMSYLIQRMEIIKTFYLMVHENELK